MARYSDTFEVGLMCSDENKIFNDKRKSIAWLKMHEKKCEACRNVKTTQQEFTIDYKIKSSTDKIRNKKIYDETVKKLTETLYVDI